MPTTLGLLRFRDARRIPLRFPQREFESKRIWTTFATSRVPKWNQLYHAHNPADPDEWTEHESSEQKLDTSLNADFNIAKIFSIFKGGISYGRTGTIQRERKLKLEYVEKLRRVLITVAREAPIPSLDMAVERGEFRSLYFHHAGSFVISETRCTSRFGRRRYPCKQKSTESRFLLDSSLRFFSEGNEPDGSLRPELKQLALFRRESSIAVGNRFHPFASWA